MQHSDIHIFPRLYKLFVELLLFHLTVCHKIVQHQIFFYNMILINVTLNITLAKAAEIYLSNVIVLYV